jgi:hypothetical protein
MFDTEAEIGVTIPGDPPKKVVIRFPTDDEFSIWRRKKKINQRDMGRGKYKLDNMKAEACDLALFKAIRVDKDSDVELDEAEALHVINRLAKCEVTGPPTRSTGGMRIELRIMKRLLVAHVMRVPSVKQMMDYEALRSEVTFGQYNSQEIRLNYTSAGDLYDKLKLSTEGYKGAVPAPHKMEVINILIQETRAEYDDPAIDDENDDEG